MGLENPLKLTVSQSRDVKALSSEFRPLGQYKKTVKSGLVYKQPPAMSRSPKLEWRDGQRRINEAGKYSLLNDIKRWRSCSVVPCGCMNRIRLWPLRHQDHSGVQIGAGGTRRSDWPARVLAIDVSTRINRLHACRDK